MKVLHILLLAIFIYLSNCKEDLDLENINVAKLATYTYGTELLIFENSHYTEQNSYKFEDFFWTGSGDGPTEEALWTSDGPTVIYKTSTVVSTVFLDTTKFNATIKQLNCTIDCHPTTTPIGEITPTPTITERNGIDDSDDEQINFSNANQQFWLLTVLQGDGKDPAIIDLKNSLAKLYKIAFQRQQAYHLGVSSRTKRAPKDTNVNVYIHEVKKVTGDDKIEVLYHVELLGKPVDAYMAANDMTLVTDDEVRKELGYPFLIKAEPYVKAAEPQGLLKAKNTWFVIGVSIIGVLLILLVLAFLSLGFAKKSTGRQPSNTGLENRHIFERSVGNENKGLVQDEESVSECLRSRENSSTYIHFGNQHMASVVLRPQSSLSAASSSSSSLDISPLMNLNKKHKTPRKKPSRPRAALNKTVPLNTTIRQLPSEIFDSDSSTSRKDESPEIQENLDPGVMSPKSFLSMPSVKSFPRSQMPEPLNRVLEPVSVTHLDMPDGCESLSRPDSYRKYGSDILIRHGSVGAMEDPGVIGPVVWRMHCEDLRHGISVDQGLNDVRKDLQDSNNISRMRKRFHNLLDDTFSLFTNSRKNSPEHGPVDDRSRPIAIDVKSHSANDNRLLEASSSLPQRPKTTGTKRPDCNSSGPTCAWRSIAPSPLIRPASAAPVIEVSGPPSAISSRTPSGILKPPKVNVENTLAEGKFKPSDSAISVIEAIKSEIEKVTFPGGRVQK
ncbi:uncharacterized protein LOC126738160 isoform X2 [Anthonomus grandis grandis]|uniref:uncharacterized protein LOC126738160 isoform X2 n=1 Tax=Anthonomus grandis grandis TaxID=2921223 RepID=UPI002166863B|nr:uncharacterized protein LOC126738160 isoform X2 [Anthonomus grandis grandis]